MKAFIQILKRFTLILTILIGGWWLTPTASADAFFIHCPNNGVGPVDDLKEAIGKANVRPGADTIIIFKVLEQRCTFSLADVDNTKGGSNGLPLITDTLTIIGNHATIERERGSIEQFRLINTRAPLRMSHLTLQNGTALDTGGAIQATAPLTLTGVTLLGNTASDDGGGLYTTAPLTLIGGRIENNRASFGNGGGFYTRNTALVSDTLIIDNFARSLGGGGYIRFGGLVKGSTFHNNETLPGSDPDGEGGGGLFVGGSFILNDSHFTDNETLGGNGGAIYATGQMTVTDSFFFRNETNTANQAVGGAIYSKSETMIQSSRFISNTGQHSGGGGYFTNDVTVLDSTFQENKAMFGNGGGLYVEGQLTLSKGVLNKNQTRHSGGGVFAATQTDISQATFIQNQAAFGGGIYSNGPLDLSVSTLQANNASENGGGLYLFGATSQPNLIVNNLWLGNRAAERGGAIHLLNSLNLISTVQIKAIHNTIIGQFSQGQAIYIANPPTSHGTYVGNNIITGYGTGVQFSDRNSGGVVTTEANLYHNNTQNEANVSFSTNHLITDPLFIDSNQGDYQLQPTSPAVDSGVDVGIAVDYRGQARPQGLGFERGAFEVPSEINDEENDGTSSHKDQIFLPLIIK